MPLSGGLGKFFQSGFVKKCCSLKPATLTCRNNKLLVIKAEYRGDKQKDVREREKEREMQIKVLSKRPLIIFPVTRLHRTLYFICMLYIYLQKLTFMSVTVFLRISLALTSSCPPHSTAFFVVMSSQYFETFIFRGGS